MANRKLRTPGTNPDEILVHLSAPTGTAAYNINGTTVHSAFLLLLTATSASKSDSVSAEKLAALRNKFSRLQLLIIDEVSMVGANLLVRIHERLSAIAGLSTTAPFAGVSVLAVGDFQQLSPVYEPPVYKSPRDKYYALADLWMTNFQVYELTEIMRQQSDTDFAQLLSRLRLGAHTANDIAVLQSRHVSANDPAIAAHPRIYSLNADVDAYNDQQLSSLPAPSVTVTAKDKRPAQCLEYSPLDYEKKSGLATSLTLKVGARVMLVRNVDTEIGLFNGALGSVTRFLPASSSSSSSPTTVLVVFDNKRLQKVASDRYPAWHGAYPVERAEARIPVRRRNNVLEATRLQFPLKVAFAMTIHKCQGQTLDAVVVSLKGYFGPGQAYVALSRCKSLSGLHITEFDPKCIKLNKAGLRALETMKQHQPLDTPHADWLNATDSIRLALLNTRSLQRHADNIVTSLYFSECDVAIFTETRLQDASVPQQFRHLQFFSAIASRQHNYVGGVAVAAAANNRASQRLDVCKETFQLLAVNTEFERQELRLTLVALYRSPTLSKAEFQRQLDEHVQPLIACSSETDPVLIVGDFNVDASHTSASNVPLRGRATQHVMKTTHVDGAILDHVYWTGPSNRISTDVVACHWSDHNTVVISVSTAADKHHYVSTPQESRTTALAKQTPHITIENSCT